MGEREIGGDIQLPAQEKCRGGVFYGRGIVPEKVFRPAKGSVGRITQKKNESEMRAGKR